MRLREVQTVPFTFDGVTYRGVVGETLAAALIANGVKLVARSFKYHRPRGVMGSGSEEPNALVTIGRGAAAEPNVRATVQEVYDGLEAFSQNAWPSLKADVMAVNDLVSPFLGAGFYYKTFMWPKTFWERVYEPIIRRAAGLGGLSGKADSETYEKAFAFCDVLVIGAGPAGLMAALVAGEAGADVILAEEDCALGGRLLSEVEQIDRRPAMDWVADTEARLHAMPNVRVMTRTAVTGAYDQGTFGAFERVVRAGLKACFWRIVAKRSVLCAGALERGIAFANNDRPGVMMAGAVRAYVNRWGVATGSRVAVFGNTGDVARTARDLTRAGIEVVAQIDAAAGARVIGTKGRHGLTSITVDRDGVVEQIDVDCLAVTGGWNPTVHLTCHMNGRPVWDETIASFVPQAGAVPDMVTAGACHGVFDTMGCLVDAAQIAEAVVKTLGMKPTPVDLPDADATPYVITPEWSVAGKGRKWIDYQNDVHVKDIELAVRENFRSVEHMKRYTTQGMAPDQGKSSNVVALAVLADVTGRGIPQTGTTTFRPPFVPVPIAAMGAGGAGMGFAPQRYTTSHEASVTAGAPMIEAGLWYRPSYFPADGEKNWRQSCDREVNMVRTSVGVVDVSTLGKIDIQGPDAAALLDFVYANTFSTLGVGRVRYGLMLREDGHVLDDGTTARLGETHYVMTTTTAAAGLVMRHLEFVLQVLRPDLDASVMSVTEQWAQFGIAGWKSREVLNGLLDEPIDDLPYMGCADITVGGVRARIFRISFSGELAFELAVPARFGAALYDALVARAAALGGGPYGMEALNVLRIEKGFITHAEIHGRVTAFDIGMDRMISLKKDCVGQAMSRRVGLLDEDRAQLVGLKPVGAVKQLSAGAHLFESGAEPVRVNGQGYITSVGFSPTLGAMLALGFLERGRARHGEVVRMVDHMRGLDAQVEVCDPVFFDPEGNRVRG
ncbi:MAG: sarcosine oxidase subunit alpha family protein [Yoonia sp.]|nr:sarcosine oxidase subunit alpha family protein [Yoonia sp.]